MDFIFFLGRFHVLVLHLPIAMVLVTVGAEWLSRKEKYRQLEGSLGYLWAVTAATSIATVVLGYMHFAEGGFSGPSATWHRFYGTSVAVAATAAWLLRAGFFGLYTKARSALGVVLVALVVLTGHYGGNLTHGDTYLVQYAPAPIRWLAGMEAARPPVTDLAQADPYLDIVGPIFEARCVSCHNNDRQRGRLNLSSYTAAMGGGESGPVIVAGDLAASDLYRRITLPDSHEDFMPSDGKTPLTAEQVSILGWWIESGALTDTTVGQMTVSEDVRPLLANQLGLGAAGAPAMATVGPAPAQSADAGLLARMAEAGFMARQVSQSDAKLIVSPVAAGMQMSAEQVAVLATAPDQIVELSLQRTGVDDSALATVSQLAGLTHLRLENNRLTDAGVRQLAGLENLEYLNLFGNEGVTDASIDTLAAMPALREIYLWQTGVTQRGADRLRQLRPELVVNTGVAAGARQGSASARIQP